MSENHLLIDKFLNNTITLTERRALEEWVLENEENKIYFKSYVSRFAHTCNQNFNWDVAYTSFLEKQKQKHSKALFKCLKYAALILIFISIGFFSINKDVENVTNISNNILETDLIKGKDIIIKLPDGSLKIVNSAGSEIIKDKNQNYIAKKAEGVLSFISGEENKNNNVKALFTEIFVPYGQIFKIKLSDGTEVSLNSGSKLKFPRYFHGTEKNRMVYLEGEAYFNVAKNKNKPFIVNTSNVNVKVYGTQFNVSSYEEDNFIETTLVEGLVSVYKTGFSENEMLIKPSFQAKYNKSENEFSKKEVDTDTYTAWMQNKIIINNLSFSEILRKLERMHNVRFENKAKKINKETFNGEFDKEDIKTILTTMATSMPFSFIIDGNVITITE